MVECITTMGSSNLKFDYKPAIDYKPRIQFFFFFSFSFQKGKIKKRSLTLGFNWKARVCFSETTSFSLTSCLASSLSINGFLSNSSWASKELMQKQEPDPEERQKQSNTLPKLSFPISLDPYFPRNTGYLQRLSETTPHRNPQIFFLETQIWSKLKGMTEFIGNIKSFTETHKCMGRTEAVTEIFPERSKWSRKM